MSVPAAVPGDVYSALPASGLVGDVLQGWNDVDLRWVLSSDWTFVGTLNASMTGAICDAVSGYGATVELRVESLQTVVEVFVNSVSVAKSSNQFIPLRVDVTAELCSKSDGSSRIEFAFTSSLSAAQAAAAAWARTQPSWTPDAPDYLDGLPHRNMLRTDQSSFGWDWGPGIAPMAVWGPAMLVVVDPCKPTAVSVLDVTIVPIAPEAGGMARDFTVRVSVNVSLQSASCEAVVLAWRMSVGDLLHVAGSMPTSAFATSPQRLTFEGVVRNPALWWPRHAGEPALHDLVVRLETMGGPDASVLVASERLKRRVGFRTVALRTDGDPLAYGCSQMNHEAPACSDGTAPSAAAALYFVINGVPIFAKGANIVPPDLLASRLDGGHDTDDVTSPLKRLVDAAAVANVNMLRVWGGGRYLPDAFYDWCAAAGIMVWQEMMFACAEYPDDDAFLHTVAQEVAHQVTRLKRSPAVVLWSGNNEDSVYDVGTSRSHYRRLNTDVVLTTIASVDRTRPLWPSSPSCGFTSGVDPATALPNGAPLVTRNASDCPGSADAHFYDYSACPDPSKYPQSPFVSEFGFEALPRLMDVLPDMSDPMHDASLFSPFMLHRQRHINGNAEVLRLVTDNLRLPPPSNATFPHFDRLTFLSQVLQAECMGSEVAAFRRGRSEASRTMGALYWQLNQVWTAPSWASVEYTGRLRPVHSMMARAFHPLFLQAVMVNSSTLRVHATNDFNAVQSLAIVVEAIDVRGGHSQWVLYRGSILLPPSGGAVQYVSIPPIDLSAANQTLFRVRAASEGLVGNGGPPPFTLPFAAKLKALDLQPSSCTFRVRAVALDHAVLRVSCNVTTLHVTLESATRFGWFQPNAFTVFAGGESAEVTYWEPSAKPSSPWARKQIEQQPALTAASLAASITIRSLNDMW